MIARVTPILLWLLLCAPALASEAAEGGHEAGLPWKSFIFTVINFAILFWLIAKPIKKMLSSKVIERHRAISQAFDEANAGIAKGRERLTQFGGLLERLPEEIAAIEREAREEIEREKAAFAKEMEEGRRRIEEQAKELADQELRAARSLLMREGMAAIAARTEQIVAGRIGPREDRAVVAAAAERLGGDR